MRQTSRKKKNGQRQALLLSALSLLTCMTMLVGSTFAWFTDSVTSSGNIVEAGTLEVEMTWADGGSDPATASWQDASTGAIFNYTKWEPGYTQARHIKIANTGDLAIKYQMRVIANGVVSELADVIDVYLFNEATKVSRDTLPEENKVGTLSEVLLQPSDSVISKNIAGALMENESDTVTIVLKMRENAGNEYQGLSIGSDFSVQLMATQLSYEKDSFDEFYDEDADYDTQEVPRAMVYRINSQVAENIEIIDQNKNSLGKGLDAAYSFQPTETYEQALSSEYSWAHADFFVYADNDVPAKSMMLAGYYSLFGDFLNIDENTWIGLTADMDVLAGEEHGIRLLADGMGLSVAYNEICNYGNDGTGFLCGATDVTGQNAGTTLAVELRLYKVACEDPGCHHNRAECETGDYITVGKFTYTFPTVTNHYDIQGVNVALSENAYKSIVYHDKNGYTDKVKSIEVYTKQDLESAVKLWKEGVMVHNGSNDIAAELIFKKDIDFEGDAFAGLSKGINVSGNGHTLSNVKFIAGEDGKAGFIPYAGNNIITGLTIKDATVNGAQAGAFAGNASNVTLSDCALEGDIRITYVDSAKEDYNGIGAVFGVSAEGMSKIDVDVTKATVTLVNDGITYPAGTTPEENNLVGVVYGGGYTIIQ